jgi:hypothetical protein
MGKAISRNLILFGEAFQTIASDPTLTVNRSSQGRTGTDLGLIGIGPGLAYYVESLNLYVSATAALARLGSKPQDSESATRIGIGAGASFMVGKEWWVSHDWGVGVAGQLYMGSHDDSDEPGAPTWNAKAFNIAFSATYN